uniref:YqaJ viral recombinase domain-containing protein n=1 Tax=Knipowitschia caucasica TaxID=637954 RepID=A0AAV2LQ69_KNICA
MGASHDALVSCDCHGTGVCEIKCPESKQHEVSLKMCAGQPGFCLIREGELCGFWVYDLSVTTLSAWCHSLTDFGPSKPDSGLDVEGEDGRLDKCLARPG